MDSFTLSAPPINQPGFDLQADRSRSIVITSIVLITAGTLSVTLRFISRWLARAGYWWDDVLVFIALPLAIVPSILNICGTQSGGIGKHVWALQPNPTWYLTNALKILFVFQIFFCLSTAMIKLSTLAFYQRIFPAAVRPLRIVLFSMATVTIVYSVISTGVSIFQCTPIHKFWNLQQPGSCLPAVGVLYGLGAVNTILDLIIVMLPVPLLWRLRTSNKQKVLLTVIFLMASFVCVVSLVRLLLWSQMNSSDITWNWAPVSMWSATEPMAGIVCACIPSLRPLFTVSWKKTLASTSTSTTSSSGTVSPPPRSPLSMTSHHRQASIFSMDVSSPKIVRPMSEDLEEMEKIARGGRPWGSNAMAYSGFDELEKGMSDQTMHIPRGHIAVKTDLRVSICENGWQYMDRVY